MTFWNLELKRGNGVGICRLGCDQYGHGDLSRENIVSSEGERAVLEICLQIPSLSFKILPIVLHLLFLDFVVNAQPGFIEHL